MERTPKYFALGLRLGILTPADVQQWVNEQIEKGIQSSELIELAYTKESDVQDTYSILSGMPDSSDTYEVLRYLLGCVRLEDLESVGFCRQLAAHLFNLWVENDYRAPKDLEVIGFFDDEYALAAEGIYGTLREWHEDFKAFVSSFRKSC